MRFNPYKTEHIHATVNNWAVLSFLIGIPLIIVAVLAVNILLAERRELLLEREQVELEFLHQIESSIVSTLSALIQGNIQRVEEALTEDTVTEAIRRLIYNDNFHFIVVFQGETRVFPPEEANAIFVSEKAVLEKLDTSLQNARNHMQQGLTLQLLVRITDPSLDSFLHCQPLRNSYEICVLIKHEQLKSLLQLNFQQLSVQSPNWIFSLNDIEGRMIARSHLMSSQQSENMKLSLGFPLQNWILKGGLQQSFANSLSQPSMFLIVMLPLLISWAFIFLILYRNQQTKLHENIKRSQIASHLSHELRTPLANLSLYIDLIIRCANDADAVKKYALIMQDEADRLERVSGITIRIAQGQEGNIKKESAQPDKIIEKLLHRFVVLFENAGCKVLFDGNARDAVIFNVAALESIVLQLLDNVCKYAGGGVVELTTIISNKYIQVSLRDYGKGIPEDQLELIFRENYRDNNDQSTGFGLGLAAARQLARLNGGDLQVKNVNPGAKFTASIKCGDTQ